MGVLLRSPMAMIMDMMERINHQSESSTPSEVIDMKVDFIFCRAGFWRHYKRRKKLLTRCSNPTSPSNNPHSGFHPGSYGPYGPQLGVGSSSGSSGDLAMSVSPPNWGSWGNHPPPHGQSFTSGGMSIGSYSNSGGGMMNGWNNGSSANAHNGGGNGSYVGSLGGSLGQSFGRERDRQLEARYVREGFTCCGRRLNGMHELLEQ